MHGTWIDKSETEISLNNEFHIFTSCHIFKGSILTESL